MNYEYEINKINTQLQNLQQNFIQAQKNNVPEVAAREAATTGTEKNTADIDYIMMMEDL